MKSWMVAFGVAAVLVMGCGPKPEDVCSHIAAVYGKDPNAAKFKAFDKDRCLSNGEMKKEFPAYKEYASCVKKTETIDAVNVCAKAMDTKL